MNVATVAGFYGKLPITGDFIQRRLRVEFTSGWDDWLQSSLHRSREILGARWQEMYAGSPPWRFALSEGVCGAQGYAGVLVPSVDSVGRYFPMAIVRSLRAGESAVSLAAGHQGWFEAAQHYVIEALSNRSLVLDQFDQNIVSLSRHVPHIPSFTNEPAGGGHFERVLSGLEEIGSYIAFAAGGSIDAHLMPSSHWWTAGSERLSPAWIATRGLPSEALFSRMLSGETLGAGSSAESDSALFAGLMGEPAHDQSQFADTQPGMPVVKPQPPSYEGDLLAGLSGPFEKPVPAPSSSFVHTGGLPDDVDLLADLMGSEDRNPTKVDDRKADILGLFDLDS